MFRISKNKGTNLFPNHLGDTPNTKKNNNQEKILISLIKTKDQSAAAQRGRSFDKCRTLCYLTALRYRSNEVDRNAENRNRRLNKIEYWLGLSRPPFHTLRHTPVLSRNDGRSFSGVSLIRAAVRPLLHEEIEFPSLL
jgi:hypothetical protein